MGRKVGIIGAGISGLLACKYVLGKGFDPIVFESQPCLGGVWTNTLETTRLQTPKQDYQFSDFPWPSSVEDEFPDHNQVIEYVGSYAVHFGLLPYIKFNTNVLNINYIAQDEEDMNSWSHWGGIRNSFSASDLKSKWEIATTTSAAHDHIIHQVDFVILCVGRHSGLVNIPDFPPDKGPDAFINGNVMHSKDYSSMDDSDAAKFVKGKRVTVVGFSKSALDIANECAMVNGVENPCTLLYKHSHWNLPIGYTSPLLDFLYLNRFSHLMFHKPGQGIFYSLLATLLTPLGWAISKYIESDAKAKVPYKKLNMIPDRSFWHEVLTCKFVSAPEKFYDRVEEGSILCKKAKAFKFYADGLNIDNDATPSVHLETDVVILATGYKGELKLKSIFKSPTFQTYIKGSSNSTVQLYRDCINPRIPQLAVIGYSDSYADLFASETRCKWLAHYLDGGFELPSIKEMEKHVSHWENFMKRYSGEDSRYICLGPLQIWYNDQLCEDMGCNPRRKKGFFAEMFEPYGPMDYADLTPTKK